MSYTGIRDLSFAEGYYHISFNGFGVVTFEENTPKSIKERFWKEWPSFRKKVIDMQLNGQFSSGYPVLPLEDPEENRRNYELESMSSDSPSLYGKTGSSFIHSPGDSQLPQTPEYSVHPFILSHTEYHLLSITVPRT